MMMKLLTPFKYFIDLLYPQVCEACERPLAEGEQLLCSYCSYDMPLTNFWKLADNPAAKLFWGRVPLNQASSLFYFTKDSRYRLLMHKLKYNGKKEIGIYLGRLYGAYMHKSPLYDTIDAIVPLPLHAKRMTMRGYTQSEIIAIGIASALQKPVLTAVLERNIATETQTNKNRMERWKNVENVFSVIAPEQLSGKHILLVDDILTTGATLEACALAILKEATCRVSVATLAYAVY